MNKEDYFKYYIQGSDHYLIPKDIFIELFDEMENWREEAKELKEKYLNVVADYETTMFEKEQLNSLVNSCQEEIEELKDFTIDLTDIDELALGLEVCSKKLNMVIHEFIDTIIQLQQENQKYKEVIDKIDKYINDYNVFEVFSFPLMKRWEEEQVKSSIDYEFKTSLIKDLKDILKEVE